MPFMGERVKGVLLRKRIHHGAEHAEASRAGVGHVRADVQIIVQRLFFLGARFFQVGEFAFQLGNRATGKVALCPMVVECHSSPMNWRQVWTHQVRWARTIRVCQPTPFFLSVLSNPTIWPLAWAFAGAWLPALVMIVLRSLGGAALEFRFTRKFHASSIILAPFSDILRTVFWLLAFAGNRIYWGGSWFRVSRGGKLAPETAGIRAATVRERPARRAR